VKVRRLLARRLAVPYACAKADPTARAIVRHLRLDIAALRDEVEAHAQAAQDARTLHVGPTDTCDIGPFCMACGSCAACACEGAL
jgi:hypothetical protein